MSNLSMVIDASPRLLCFLSCFFESLKMKSYLAFTITMAVQNTMSRNTTEHLYAIGYRVTAWKWSPKRRTWLLMVCLQPWPSVGSLEASRYTLWYVDFPISQVTHSFTEKERNEILLEVPLGWRAPNTGCCRQGELSRESQPAVLVRFLESACYYECNPFQSSVLLPKIPSQSTSSWEEERPVVSACPESGASVGRHGERPREEGPPQRPSFSQWGGWTAQVWSVPVSV